MKKPAISQAPLHELIAERWSGRSYDANRAVSSEHIISLLEAARWAPSCYGDQPWRFLVWDKNTDAASWQKALDCLVPFNQGWAKDAPLLILIAADTLFNHNGKPNRWGGYDTGAAAESLMIQATAFGMMTHQMGGFDSDKARAEFAIPEQFELMAMMSVGYAADPASLSAEDLAREQTPRTRRALGELFFTCTWGKPVV